MRNIDKANELMQQFAQSSEEQKIANNEEFSSLISNLLKEPNKSIDDGFAQSNEPAPIGALSRAGLKAFMVRPHDAVKKLSDDYPELDFLYNSTGNVFARAKKAKPDTPWNPIDPTTNPFEAVQSAAGWKEMGQDILDTSADMAKGVVGTAGSILGGIAGAGVGSIPLAMAGGAAASGAAEAARQGLSMATGWSEGMSPADIGWDAAFGSIAPMLFGTGIGANWFSRQVLNHNPKIREILKKTIESTGRAAEEIAGFTDDQLLDAAGKMYRHGGLLPGASNTASNVIRGKGASSEISEDTIDYMTKHPREMVSQATEVLPMWRELGKDVMTFGSDKIKEAKRAMDSSLQGKLTDATDVMNALANASRAPYRLWKTGVPGTRQTRQAKEVVGELGDAGLNIGNLMDPNNMLTSAKVNRVRTILNDLAKWGSVQGSNGQPITDSSKIMIQKAARNAKKKLTSAMEADTAGGDAAKAANSQYSTAASNLRKFSEALTTKSGGPRKVDATKVAGSFKSGEKVALEEILKKTMSPAEYAKYVKSRNKAVANSELLGAKESQAGFLGTPFLGISNKSKAKLASNVLRLGKVTSPLTQIPAKLQAPAIGDVLQGRRDNGGVPQGPGSQKEINRLRELEEPYVRQKLQEYIINLGKK